VLAHRVNFTQGKALTPVALQGARQKEEPLIVASDSTLPPVEEVGLYPIQKLSAGVPREERIMIPSFVLLPPVAVEEVMQVLMVKSPEIPMPAKVKQSSPLHM